MEVTNSLPQPSHDQAWSMRPRTLKRDSSAMSRTLPQRGHFGRPRFWVPRPCDEKARWADWTVIVDPPRRPNRSQSYPADSLWHDRDGGVKLSWRNPQPPQSVPYAVHVTAIACRWVRNWCGRTSDNPPICRWHRVPALTTSPRQTALLQHRGRPRARAGYRFRRCSLPWRILGEIRRIQFSRI
jgi:hypothetical protein